MLKYQAKILMGLVENDIDIEEQNLDLHRTDNNPAKIKASEDYLEDLQDILGMLESEISLLVYRKYRDYHKL